MGRRWMIFLAYLVIEVCFLGSLIAQFSSSSSLASKNGGISSSQNLPTTDSTTNTNNVSQQTDAALITLYHLCRFATHFGFIFLMLITAELFPTSLRCTGMGICFTLKMIGSLIASKNLASYFY
jgi:hypothetical protein